MSAAIRTANPATMAAPGGHYSHAVTGGGLVFVSGQVAMNAEGQVVGSVGAGGSCGFGSEDFDYGGLEGGGQVCDGQNRAAFFGGRVVRVHAEVAHQVPNGCFQAAE